MKIKKWLYRLLYSVIGSVANTFVAMAADPKTFNFTDLSKLGKFAAGSAIVSLFLYLQKEPLPPLEGDTEILKK